jgi:hypothetical protein
MPPLPAAPRGTRNLLFLLVLLTAVCGWNGVAALLTTPTTSTQHPAIFETALGMVLCWFAAVAVGVASRDPALVGVLGAPEVRLLYTWGCGMCLLHVAVAFHVAHAWSHNAAWEHVDQTGGFGAGLYANYLFVAVWVADVIWAWVSLGCYLNRPRWVSWCVHGFMAFMVFNATVVFGTGVRRYFGAMLFAALGVLLVRAAYNPETPEPGTRPGSGDSVERSGDHSPT